MRIRTVDKPVIAAVNGPAAGIGCSLALACDLIVAARSAYFLLAFVNIGLGLDGGASQILTARVGAARAFEMAYLGERIGAEQALEWGMINRVVDDEALESAVGELAARLAAGAPGSYATIKRTINARASTTGSPSCSTWRRSCSSSAPSPGTSGRRSWRSRRSARRRSPASSIGAVRSRTPVAVSGGEPPMNLASTVVGPGTGHDPDHVAVRLDDIALSYAAVDIASAHLAGLLAEHGIVRGDRVGIMLPNLPHFPVCYYGALRRGAVVVPMNVLLKRREVAYYLSDSGAKLLFAWEGFAEDAAGRRRRGRRGVRRGRRSRASPSWSGPPRRSRRSPRSTARTRRCSSTRRGTTGQPKGAELTHANLTRNAKRRASCSTKGAEAIVPRRAAAVSLLRADLRDERDARRRRDAHADAALRSRQGARDHRSATRSTSSWACRRCTARCCTTPTAATTTSASLKLCASGGSAMPVELMRAFEDGVRLPRSSRATGCRRAHRSRRSTIPTASASRARSARRSRASR